MVLPLNYQNEGRLSHAGGVTQLLASKVQDLEGVSLICAPTFRGYSNSSMKIVDVSVLWQKDARLVVFGSFPNNDGHCYHFYGNKVWMFIGIDQLSTQFDSTQLSEE